MYKQNESGKIELGGSWIWSPVSLENTVTSVMLQKLS